MTIQPPTAVLGLLAAFVFWCAPPLAQAGEGHDHGAAAAVAAGPALPRFTAVSETFELVGVLQGRQLTLYLDRAADNTPVSGARIELDIAGARLQAQPHDDLYEVVLAAEPQPGVLPITATITAGQDTDLLAGELDLHAQVAEAAPARSWRTDAAWSGGAFVGLLGLLGLMRLAHRARARANTATDTRPTPSHDAGAAA